MKTSLELHQTLATLEAAVTEAGERLVAAETAHHASVREAITNGDSNSILTESALADAHATFNRATVARDIAEQLVAEAVKREAEEAEAVARASIESQIAEMLELADQIDGDFAKAVGRLMRLRELEAKIHRAANQAFRSPWSAPVALTVAAPIANFLRSLMNGAENVDFRPWTAELMQKAARNIRETYS